MLNNIAVLKLLQLASPVLPVGAYSYSDGLENLVERGVVDNSHRLRDWLEQELLYGAIRLEAAVMIRAYRSAAHGDVQALSYWNAWLTAAKETAELRSQSLQMGNSLMRLLLDLSHLSQTKTTPSLQDWASAVGTQCNYAIAFGLAAYHWQINLEATVLGYLHSWASNLIAAGVKLIPLGQTIGQELLLELSTSLTQHTQDILIGEDEQLSSCGWALALASMAHETQYTRLFRS